MYGGNIMAGSTAFTGALSRQDLGANRNNRPLLLGALKLCLLASTSIACALIAVTPSAAEPAQQGEQGTLPRVDVEAPRPRPARSARPKGHTGPRIVPAPTPTAVTSTPPTTPPPLTTHPPPTP